MTKLRPRMTLAEAMTSLEEAGSAQTRKTYLRHGAPEPLFGVSFATLKSLLKRIKVDQELALGLWATGNYDARNLAVKGADPRALTLEELDAWAADPTAGLLTSYVACLAQEGGHGAPLAERWLAAKDEGRLRAAWHLVGALATHDLERPAAWFSQRLAELKRDLHNAPNEVRRAMNGSLILIGGRDAAHRQAALATAAELGPVSLDHGDTDCKTSDARTYTAKAWDHAEAKGASSPAAMERARAPLRLRC
jgi:3-methyladenine DNA glycosylase AlkD